MLRIISCISLLALPMFLQPQASYAFEKLGINECIQKHPDIEHTLLSAFRDPKPTGKRPIAYYQIGAIVTRRNNNKTYIPYLVVKHQSGDCQAIRINLSQGYEPYVPGTVAIEMEVQHFQWRAKKVVKLPPKEEWSDEDPANFGHGCEPIPQSMAAAMRRINYEYECPVMKTRQPLIWDQQ